MKSAARLPFGSLLHQFRQERGLSGRALAERAGLDSTYISRLERGVVHPPKIPTVHRLAEALRLDPTDEIALIDSSGRLPDTMTLVPRARIRSEAAHEPRINPISMRETVLGAIGELGEQVGPTAASGGCFATILPWIVELYGDRAVPRENFLAVDIYQESGVSCVVVLPRGDNAMVRTISRFTTRTELTAEFSQFLLKENANVDIGCFAMDVRGDVCFQHTIPRSGCTKESVQESVLAVASAFGRYGDLFIACGPPQRN
jgi:transcriptional regulator with XRE-family HTH domain